MLRGKDVLRGTDPVPGAVHEVNATRRERGSVGISVRIAEGEGLTCYELVDFLYIFLTNTPNISGRKGYKSATPPPPRHAR